MVQVLLMACLLSVSYIFFFRPNQKRQKEAKAFRDAVKKGDQVVTIGGLHGKVVSVSEKTVVLDFESGKARVDKTALSPNGTAEGEELEAKS